MIQRPALAAVLDALRGTDDPRVFEETLIARDLWPATNAPEVVPLRWEASDGEPDEYARWVRRARLTNLASVVSCGLPALRTVEELLRELDRLPGEGSFRALWMTASWVADAGPPFRSTWQAALSALREGVAPDLPLGVDPSFLEPLRSVFALGFDVVAVAGSRVDVVVPPIEDAANPRR